MSNIKIGYARVSTLEQNTAAQEKILKEEGCTKLYIDYLSGKNDKRPELKAMLDFIRSGDTLVVTKLDRLARSTADLLKTAEDIKQKGAALKVLDMQIDTNTPAGSLIFTIFSGLAQFERENMLQRQRDGIAIAKEENKYKGRKKIDTDKLNQAQQLISSGMSVTKAAEEVGIGRRTYYKAMSEGRIDFKLEQQHIDEI
jgi:DNA invertase Pin-like site-specific DNA recombinase